MVAAGLCSFPKLALISQVATFLSLPTASDSACCVLAGMSGRGPADSSWVPPRTPPHWLWTALVSLCSSSVAAPRAPPPHAAMVGVSLIRQRHDFHFALWRAAPAPSMLVVCSSPSVHSPLPSLRVINLVLAAQPILVVKTLARCCRCASRDA
uniref:Secreted protein n=2 Tax=Zea mays TaxID=4577 RepID=A0A804LIH1_MAIZE